MAEPKNSKLHRSLVSQPTGGTNNRVFAAVPSTLRSTIIERLTLLIEYRRKHDWHNFVRLLSSHIIRGRSAEGIVQNYANNPGLFGTNYDLLAFEPRFTSFLEEDGGKWIISGCTRLSEVAFPVESFVVAWRENDNWYFSDIDTAIRDTGFIKCTRTTKSLGSVKGKKRRHRK